MNPARLLRMAKENNERTRFLNQYKPLPTKIDYLKDCHSEEDRLRTVIRTKYPEHLPEFEIGLATGMRHSEMYSATWPNVDLKHRVLTVPRSKHGETRYVTLGPTARAVLEFLEARAGDSDYVFLSMRGDRPLKAIGIGSRTRWTKLASKISRGIACGIPLAADWPLVA